MQDLKNISFDELKEVSNQLGFSTFKAKEIFKFIHQKLINSLDDLTTIKLEERKKLKQSFCISSITPTKTEKAKDTVKGAFQLEDGKIIEAVLMNYGRGRTTVCVSTQVGCPIGCKFCATGQMGFSRNLTTAEILSQVYFFANKHKISNIVFMGMGEPFLNFDNSLKAGKILNNESGLNIASRKIVFSTIGIIPGIKKFAQESKQLRLAWSLVAPFDELRRKLIPYKGLATIKETIKALQDYQKKSKRRITIEYIVFKNLNDDERSLKELIEISRQLDSHVNLISFNPTAGNNFRSGDASEVMDRLKKLSPRLNVTIRASLGKEISAACGQLAAV
ncbi:23S rRNA (adenine(2503)-C(2))-methyltransferase RlmN [Candidatus Margulisiibacteriota bacterium]